LIHSSSERDKPPHDVVHEKQSARRHMGVCPQQDVIVELLTVREHLHLFARIRGVVNFFAREQMVQEFAQALDLNDKLDSRAHSLSGGQKRRLQIGMALIASPKAIILDEPTTGLDPDSRRVVWDFLIRSRTGRGILLVSHSMEESEALGNRIVIMSHGQIQAEGTSQELKDRFGTSFLLTLRIEDSNGNLNENGTRVDEFIRREYPDSSIDESFGERLAIRKYMVPRTSTASLSGIFEKLLKGSRDGGYGIIDFSISQSTLEDVFLKFANLEDDRAEKS